MSEKFWEDFIKKGEEAVRLWDLSSVSVGVIKDGETVFAHSFGKKDIENGLDADPDTLYQIGSCSKSFTAAICCALVDQGLLKLDEPIRTYCPEIRFFDEFTTNNVTLRDLLSHRTGLPRHESAWLKSPFTRQQLCENIRYLEPNEAFRTKMQYCNFGYILAGYICEKVSGKTWEALLQELILEPLQMGRSTPYVTDIKADPNHAVPYGRPADGDGISGHEAIDFHSSPLEDKEKGIGAPFGPAGSINSCVSDMLKWVRFHLDNGKAGDRQLISEEMMTQMCKPQMIRAYPFDMPNEFTDFMCYGLGWFLETYHGHKYVFHGGNINGFSSYTAFVPDQKLGIVILSNMNGHMSTYSLGRTIVDHYLGYDCDWVKKYRDFAEKMSKAAQDPYAALTGPRTLYTVPSYPITDYAGTYARDGYPALKIEEEDNILYFCFADMRVPLEHYHYDVFAAAETGATVDKGFPLFFGGNENGTHIASVCIPLLSEPKTKALRFDKQ